MAKSDLDPESDRHAPPLPVICDRCRAEGMAGDPAFSAIPDLLAFDPVTVRAHANNWTPEHQRAFIAAIALTGSPNKAARAIGRYAGGADRLRRTRGGKSFADAWEAALEIARDRELAHLHDTLHGLGREQQQRDSRHGPSPTGGTAVGKADFPAEPGPHVRAIYGDDYDPDEYLEGHADFVDAQGSIRDRLLRARRLYLAVIADDPPSRAAWEVLAGPVHWKKARAHEPQDNEPGREPRGGAPAIPNLREPDMLLTADAGFLPELTGGPDALAELRQALAEMQAERLHSPSGAGGGAPAESSPLPAEREGRVHAPAPEDEGPDMHGDVPPSPASSGPRVRSI